MLDAVAEVVSLAVSASRPAHQGAGILIVALVIALVLPGALALYLVTDTAGRARLLTLTAKQGRLTRLWRRPHQEFQAKLREADRLDAASRSDVAAEFRLSAITEFSGKANEDRLVEHGDNIQRNLVLAAAHRPSGAVKALAELDRHCPRCVTGDMTSSVVREWARSRGMARFGDDWATIEKVLTSKSQDPLEVLLDACQSVSRDELTETFRRGVTVYLWDYLDRNLRLATFSGGQGLSGHSSAFALLDLVGPRDLTRAGQLCALGDLALARKVSGEALRRYEAAVERGSVQAAQRLAYHQAREGHRLLVAGNFAAARRQFAEACRLHKDREYAFLVAIAGLLSNDADSRAVLDQLEALDGTGAPTPYVTFWRAIAHLREGQESQAIVLLRGLGRQHSDGDQLWGPGEEAAVLLAVLEGDDHVLIDCARRLVRASGARWLAAGPTDPWPMVAAVARHDRALLAEMVVLINDPGELPEWVRVAGAHALLTKSVEFARKGRAGEAVDDAEAATRLLERRRRTTSSGSH